VAERSEIRGNVVDGSDIGRKSGTLAQWSITFADGLAVLEIGLWDLLCIVSSLEVPLSHILSLSSLFLPFLRLGSRAGKAICGNE
jgi:hypothetical protein